MASWRRPARTLVVCASLAVLAALCGCTDVAARVVDQSQQSEQLLDDLLPADEPGCSAAVARRGDVVWAGAEGIADLELGTPLTVGTRFDIASVSKQFTATAILMLQRDGMLSVSDPVAEHLDGLPDWADDVTLDQLMHHTSRIPDFWVELDAAGIGFADPADQATTVAAIARETELDPDGTGFLYSNSNYVLLAEVVERVSGLALPDFLAERVFGPLGLDMVLAPGLEGADVARPYGDTLVLEQSGWTAYGHVGIFATAGDLARWGEQYRAGDIVQHDFDDGAVDDGEGELYAAGINVQPDDDLNHIGRWGGYLSEFTVSFDRELTIAVLCNGHGSDRWGVADGLWAIWDPEHPRRSPPR